MCRLRLLAILGIALLVDSRPLLAQATPEEDLPPINYASAPVNDAVARLQKLLDAGKAELKWDKARGYLPALLNAFQIDPASQVLVFSKTSLQQRLISAARPRAIYFNDSTYLGWVQSGTVMEVVSMDPQVGIIYYTIDQRPQEKPKFERQTDSCRVCHTGAMADNIPGLMVRSVYANRVGEGFLRSKSFISDHTSPLSKRFGGWYVTGTSGTQLHMGNLFVGSESAIESADLSRGTNLTDLSKMPVEIEPYIVPTSDIVALMVLEHQARGHNLLVRANWQTRRAIAAGKLSREAIAEAVDPLVMYFLFANEAQLTSQIAGNSDFAANFTARGPRDSLGRSLRDFDLTTRMMKHPLSWLIYTEEFDGLPEPALKYFAERVGQLLCGEEVSPALPNLTPQTRAAIIEIVKQTKPQLAKDWSPAR
jgi:hypothetical protein